MILRLWHKVAPVLSMVVALIVLWYGAAIWLNTHWAEDKAQRAGVTLTITALIADTWSQEKPKLPAPHQGANFVVSAPAVINALFVHLAQDCHGGVVGGRGCG